MVGKRATHIILACSSPSIFCVKIPGAGQVDEDSGLGLRRWRYRQHRIFYRVAGHAILIVRVFHVAADTNRWLGD